jgi:hypothetical protein
MIPMPGKVGRPVGVRYISYEAENGERVANKRVYSPTAGFTALRHLRPAIVRPEKDLVERSP